MSRIYHQLRPKKTRVPEVAPSVSRLICIGLSWQRAQCHLWEWSRMPHWQQYKAGTVIYTKCHIYNHHVVVPQWNMCVVYGQLGYSIHGDFNTIMNSYFKLIFMKNNLISITLLVHQVSYDRIKRNLFFNHTMSFLLKLHLKSLRIMNRSSREPMTSFRITDQWSDRSQVIQMKRRAISNMIR